jgi:hypothetical protein
VHEDATASDLFEMLCDRHRTAVFGPVETEEAAKRKARLVPREKPVDRLLEAAASKQDKERTYVLTLVEITVSALGVEAAADRLLSGI